jgi:hypothetical protein
MSPRASAGARHAGAADCSAAVDAFMVTLDHPARAAIQRLRSLLLGADPRIAEGIKWNAPSFRYRGDDRLTFNLHPKDRIQLVFHRGAKVKDNQDFVFEDHSSLLEWRSEDRALLTLMDMDDYRSKEQAVVSLVKQWVETV